MSLSSETQIRRGILATIGDYTPYSEIKQLLLEPYILRIISIQIFPYLAEKLEYKLKSLTTL